MLADRVRAILARGGETEMTVGIQGTQAAADVNGEATQGQIAVWLHYGTDRIPARPWLAITGHEHGRSWLRYWARAAREAEDDGAYMVRMRRLGVAAVADCKATIAGKVVKENAKSTARRKGGPGATPADVTPLVDTSTLLNAHRAVLTVGDREEIIG